MEGGEGRRDVGKKTKRRRGIQKIAYLATSTLLLLFRNKVSCRPALPETG